MVRRKLVLPIEPSGRTSGIKAAFLCDNGGYLLGLDDKHGAEKFEASRALHADILSNTDSAAANAVLAFFRAGPPANIADFIDVDTASKAVFVFMVNNRFVCMDDEDIRRAWDAFYAKTDEKTEPIICLVTGKRDIPEKVHGTVRLRGGQPSGSTFIGANCESFASYGKTVKDRAADVGKYAAFAYVTALNDLLRDEKHRRFIGGDTLVFWAEKGGEAEEDLFGNLLDPPEANEDSDLLAAVAKIARGDMVADYQGERKFYLLCLSPNSGRISVRFFYTDTFGVIVRHIQEHYIRLDIIGNNKTSFRFLPLWLILSETTVTGKAADASPLLGGQLLRCILTGTDYPMSLYEAILTRVRAGGEISRAKAAVVKAVLIKDFNESEVSTVALNEQSDNKPYVLGRLFAVLERLQAQANGSATIRGRYFTSACANPGSVFPTLLSLSMHHAEKLDNAVFFEKLKGELLVKLDDAEPFPAALSLDDQGRFILGYYHQTQWFFTKKSKEEVPVNE